MSSKPGKKSGFSTSSPSNSSSNKKKKRKRISINSSNSSSGSASKGKKRSSNNSCNASSSSSKNKKNNSLFGPFNVMPMTRKGQSKQDKKKYKMMEPSRKSLHILKRHKECIIQNNNNNNNNNNKHTNKKQVRSTKKTSKLVKKSHKSTMTKPHIFARTTQDLGSPSSYHNNSRRMGGRTMHSSHPTLMERLLVHPNNNNNSSNNNNNNSSTKKKWRTRGKKNSTNKTVDMMSALPSDTCWYMRDVPWNNTINNENATPKSTVTSGDCKQNEFYNKKEEGAKCSKNEENNPINQQQQQQDDERNSQYRLPTDTIHPKILSILDDEIASFGSYVKLTPAEINAREYLIRHVTDLSRDLFDTRQRRRQQQRQQEEKEKQKRRTMATTTMTTMMMSRTMRVFSGNKRKRTEGDGHADNNNDDDGNGGNNDHDDDDDDDVPRISVVPYGSFATQDVCTFSSDVDLALWGAVPAPTRTTFFPSIHDYEGVNDGDDDKLHNGIENNNNNDGGGGDRSKDRLQKWRDALASTRSCDDVTVSSATSLGGCDKKEEEDLGGNGNVGETKVAKKGVAAVTTSPCPLEKSKSVIETQTVAGSQSNKQDDFPEEQHCNSNFKKSNDEKNDTDNSLNGQKAGDLIFVIDREGALDLGHCDDDDADKNGNVSVAEEQKTEFKSTACRIDTTQHAITSCSNVILPNAVGKGLVDVASTVGAVKTGSVADAGNESSKHQDNNLKQEGDSAKTNDYEVATVPTGNQFSALDVDDEEADDGKAVSILRQTDTEMAAQIVEEGTSISAPIEIYDSSDVNQSEAGEKTSDNDGDDNDNDDDSADKMESFYKRERRVECSAVEVIDVDDSVETTSVKERLSGDGGDRYIVNLSSSTSSSENDDDDSFRGRNGDFVDDDDDLEVSFFSKLPGFGFGRNGNGGVSLRQAAAVGPTGETRKLVVNALKALGRKLWKSSVTHNVEVRRHARVPIIVVSTRLGFDGDIALGGHNGTDTSLYAQMQARRFRSFAPVVLLLKVLLQQTDLDKPFTGGLGSYKLYVLVAHHLERHVALGGADRPSEVLISFLFRYSGLGINGMKKIHPSAVTRLSQDVNLYSHGGSADLQPVFKIDYCVKLFGLCFERFMNRCQDEADKESTVSYLGGIIDVAKLKREREECLRKSTRLSKHCCKKPAASGLIRHDHPGKVTAGRRIGHVFAKPTEASFRRTENLRAANDSILPSKISTDDEADQLMAGYGLARGPHGGLIPRNRPDVEAREAEKADPNVEILGRASKRTKNKKKQNRDKALREYATGMIDR